MADQVPVNFTPRPQPAIASYDFVDIADKTGYIIFNAGKAGSATSVLFNQTFFSNPKLNSNGSSTGDEALIFTLDFDVVLNAPFIAKGKALAEIVHYHAKGSGYGGNFKSKVRFKIVHYDGSTETVLGTSGFSDELNSTGSTSFNLKRVEFLRADLTTKKFKAGDTLRFKVEGYRGDSSSSGSPFQWGIHFDPVDRDLVGNVEINLSGNDGTGQNTLEGGRRNTRAFIPFKIDL